MYAERDGSDLQCTNIYHCYSIHTFLHSTPATAPLRLLYQLYPLSGHITWLHRNRPEYTSLVPRVSLLAYISIELANFIHQIRTKLPIQLKTLTSWTRLRIRPTNESNAHKTELAITSHVSRDRLKSSSRRRIQIFLFLLANISWVCAFVLWALECTMHIG